MECEICEVVTPAAIAIVGTRFDPFYRGETVLWEFNFAIAEVPIDVTGWQVWWTLKKNPGDADSMAALQVVTTAGCHTLDDPVNGKIFLEAPSDKTAQVVGDIDYYSDFRRVIPCSVGAPIVDSLGSGKICVLVNITQSNVYSESCG